MRKIVFATMALCAALLYAQDIEEINIENAAVQAYMADDTYFYNSDYNTSVVRQYNVDEYGTNRGLPAGKVVSWFVPENSEDIAEIRITVSENPDYSDAITHKTNTIYKVSYVIRNTVPGHTYYYKVENHMKDGTVEEVANGVFSTVGQVRMIDVDGSSNVRDLGGWPTTFGVPIKYGLLYRSAGLDAVTATGIHEFAENLGVSAELDLRGDATIESSPLGENVDYFRISGGMYYSGLTTKGDRSSAALKWIIDRLREGKIVDMHCSAGSDRVGLLSFLIEGLLGVEEVDLCRDYELSTFSGRLRERNYEKTTNDTFPQLLPYIYTCGPENDLAQCFYNYWLNLGLAAEDLNYFRSVMLGIKDVPTHVEDIAPAVKQQGIYNINGVKLDAPCKGFNIIVNSDGSVEKKMVF